MTLTLRRVLIVLAAALFSFAWWITLGHDVFDSVNAAAFGYAGLVVLTVSMAV